MFMASDCGAPAGPALAVFGSTRPVAHRRAFRVLPSCAVLAVTALLWAPTLTYQTVYEDRQFPPVQWRGLSTELAEFQFRHPARFVSNLSYRATHAVSLEPWADHAGNVLVHIVNTGLVMLAAWPVFGMFPALLAGSLFGTLRLQTEAVAYISSRPDLLVATGILMALCAVSWRRYWLLPLGLIVAALSKETGVMAAPLALLWAWQIDRPIPRRIVGGFGLLAGLMALGHWFEFSKVWLGSSREISDHLAMLGRLLLLIWPIGHFTMDHDWSWINPGWSLLAFLVTCFVLHEYALKKSWWGFALVFALVALLPRILLSDPEGLHEHHMASSGTLGFALACGGRLARCR